MNQSVSTDNIAAQSVSAELAELKAAYDLLMDRQARIMELIGTTDANHLIHDIRNILNERELLRALTNLQD